LLNAYRVEKGPRFKKLNTALGEKPFQFFNREIFQDPRHEKAERSTNADFCSLIFFKKKRRRRDGREAALVVPSCEGKNLGKRNAMGAHIKPPGAERGKEK